MGKARSGLFRHVLGSAGDCIIRIRFGSTKIIPAIRVIINKANLRTLGIHRVFKDSDLPYFFFTGLEIKPRPLHCVVYIALFLYLLRDLLYHWIAQDLQFSRLSLAMLEFQARTTELSFILLLGCDKAPVSR